MYKIQFAHQANPPTPRNSNPSRHSHYVKYTPRALVYARSQNFTQNWIVKFTALSTKQSFQKTYFRCSVFQLFSTLSSNERTEREEICASHDVC